MKNKFWILLSLCFIIWNACSPVHFYNAMPMSYKSYNSIDSGLIGKYVLKDSIVSAKKAVLYNSRYFKDFSFAGDSIGLISAELTIDKQKVVYFVKTYDCFNLDKVDSMRINEKYEGWSKMYSENRIIFYNSFSDTIVNLDKKDQLKKYGKKMYLNKFIEAHDWEIFQIDANSIGTLVLSTTSLNDKKKGCEARRVVSVGAVA